MTSTNVKEEVKFEGVMEKKSDNSITLKEVYTDLVATKTILSEMRKRGQRTEYKFTLFTVVVIGIELINLIFNYYMYKSIK